MARFVVIASIVLGACDVGSVIDRNGIVDGGTTIVDGATALCEQLATPPDDGHHNAGQGCLSNAACHNAGLGLGAGAPEFSYGGTLYRDAAGTQPYPGGTILITMAGVTKKVIAGTNGNFHVSPGLLAAPTNQATANVKASTCPATTPMGGALTAAGGNCNAAGTCHGGTQGKLHLP